MFKKLWKWIQSLFKEPSDSPQPGEGYSEPEIPNPPASVKPQVGTEKRIAIIVGHTKSSKGAASYSVNGIRHREYDWNRERAEEMKAHLDQFHENKVTKIFYRDGIGRSGVAKMVGKWNADVCLELHFNSIGHDRDAYGAEMLVLKGDDASAKVGFAFIDELTRQFKMKKRRTYPLKTGEDLRGVKPLGSKDRGQGNLRYVKNAGVPIRLLIEPFFAGTRTDESKQFIQDPGKYSRIIGRLLGEL